MKVVISLVLLLLGCGPAVRYNPRQDDGWIHTPIRRGVWGWCKGTDDGTICRPE